jgi:uncharacterized protein YjbJ (UPF0337 family)
MRKHGVKGKAGDAAGRAKHQAKKWTADTKAQVEDTARKVNAKAEKGLDQIKDAVRDVMDRVTGGG